MSDDISAEELAEWLDQGEERRTGFKRWLLSLRSHPNKVCRDFISDAKIDARLPDVGTWGELDWHLLERRACSGARDAAQMLWKEWLRKRESVK
jgi:hypothetical protein